MTKTGVVIYCENVLKDLMAVKETSAWYLLCCVITYADLLCLSADML